MMITLRELHLQFRTEDRRDQGWRERLVGKRECPKATRCDPDTAGLCRWCRKPCAERTPAPAAPYDLNEGAILIQEAYDYHYNPDGADLPFALTGSFYVGSE